MTFWLVLFGVPAALAAVGLGWTFNWKLGLSFVIAILGSLAAAYEAGFLISRPSHVERLAARAYAGDRADPSRVHCHRAELGSSRNPIYKCIVESGLFLIDHESVCVELLPTDEAQLLDDFECD